MKRMKKLLLVVAAVALLTVLFCVTAFAETYSGNCGAEGDNLTWSLDTETGTLTISGTGDMANFASPDYAPWYVYRSLITTVVVENGVAGIGDLAFYNCKQLTAVSLPESLTRIGQCSFGFCSVLSDITIPKNVTYIGANPFRSCFALDSLAVAEENLCFSMQGNCLIETETGCLISVFDNSVIPNDGSVKKIGSFAFYGCRNLTSITIPDSVTAIGYSAFYNCTSLTSVTVLSPLTVIPDNQNTFPAVAEIHGYENSTAQAYAEKYNRTFVSIGVKEGTAASGTCGAEGENLTWTLDYNGTLTISGTGDMVADFSSPDYAPWYDYRSLIRTVDIKEGVTTIGNLAFYGCDNLTDIVVDKKNGAYRSIGGNLYTKDGKTLVQYAIGKQEMSFTIPADVTTIGSLAFCNCSNLTSVTIPDSVTKIGNSAFSYCTSLTSVTIPDSVTTIGYMAFYNCFDLTSVTIPDSVAAIGCTAFDGCEKLTSITFLSPMTIVGDDSYTIPEGATIYAPGGSLAEMYANNHGRNFVSTGEADNNVVASGTINSNSYWLLTEDGELRLYGIGYFGNNLGSSNVPWRDHAASIKSLYVGSGISGIDAYVSYYLSKLESITVDEANEQLTVVGNCLIHVNGALYIGCKNSVIPTDGSVTRIYWYAFRGRTGLVSIDIPASVEEICSYAFMNCENLASITLPDGIALGEGVFINCKALTSLTLPAGISSIPTALIQNCKGITEFTIPASVVEIQKQAFRWAGIVSITVPQNVQTIGEKAFLCESMTSITFLNPIVDIYDSAETVSLTATIYGHENSTAQAYAEKYNRTFVVIEPPYNATVNDAMAFVGETVTVTISLDNIPDVKSIAINKLVYDETVFTLLEAEWNLKGVMDDWDPDENVGVFAFGENTDVDGAILTLTFAVSETAADGDYTIDCKVTVNSRQGNLDVPLNIKTESGKVSVASYILGDINDDGVINSDDAIYLLRYTLLPNDYPIKQSGDMNNDGVVNSDDAIYLLRYTLLPNDYPLIK